METVPEPILSVIIVNWNTKEHLRRCLQSLISAHQKFCPPSMCALHSKSGNFSVALRFHIEIIVVDNASVDGSAEMVRSEFPQVRLIANKCNVGYAAANNQGAAVARGRYLLLLNPDTVVTDEALARLIEFAETHPNAGAVAPKLLYPDGTLQPSLRSFPTPMALLSSVLGLDKIFPQSQTFGRYRMTWFHYDQIAEVEQPMASALLVRREAWERVGGLDETMPIFFNDVDFCWRLKRAGWRIYFLPWAIIIHHHGASTQLLGIGRALASHRGLLRFYDKHFRPLMPIPLYWILRSFISLGSQLRVFTSLVKITATPFIYGKFRRDES